MIKINMKKWGIYLVAFSTLLMLNPYIIWDTYSKFNNILYQIIMIATVGFELFYFITERVNITKRQVILILLLISYYLYITINSVNSGIVLSFKMGFIYLQIIAFVLFHYEDKKKIFNLFVALFAISLIFSIVVWVLLRLNINMNYQVLTSESPLKANLGYYYKQYFGAVFLDNFQNPDSMYRLCGLYDEPGVVGTISALLLVADDFRLKRMRNIILFIGGILSFSFAFFCLIFIYFVIKIFCNVIKKGIIKLKRKNILLILICLVGISFTPMLMNNTYIYRYVVLRMKRTLIIGDNRTTNGFDKEYKNLLNSDNVINLVFGKGSGAVVNNPEMTGSNSYKSQIYDLGLFGFVFMYFIIFYACFLLYKTRSLHSILLFLIFCISTYQRIGIMNLYYFVILIGGTINDTKINIEKARVIPIKNLLEAGE